MSDSYYDPDPRPEARGFEPDPDDARDRAIERSLFDDDDEWADTFASDEARARFLDRTLDTLV